MKAILTPHLFVGLAMLAAAGLALAVTLRFNMVDEGPKINLEAMIPQQFGEWKLAATITPFRIDPELKSNVDKTYSQTLTRDYINSKGEHIMLVVAYGGDKSRSMHLPEVCYPAQGFQIGSLSKRFIDYNGSQLPVMTLVATQGNRIEPITYWIVIGDMAVRGRWEQHLARLKYGLAGKIPSGILIRVSAISVNESEAYRIEEQFVWDMLRAVPMQYRKVLTGVDL
jgi:EpsI family protein